MAKKAKSGEHDKDNEDEVVGQEQDKVEREAVEQDKAERAAVRAQVAGQPYEGAATIELLETTDVEDIQALSDAIVAVIQGAAYDDMTWPEVDMALRRTSHAIRQNWSATGTVKAAEPAPPEDPLRSAEEKPRYAG